MPLTVTCPSCAQMCQVEDQHAGMMVRCPKCAGVIQVQPAAPVAAVVPPPVPPPPVDESPPAPSIERGPGFLEAIQQSATAWGVTGLDFNLLVAGLGCLAAGVIFSFLPWLIHPFTSTTVLGMGLWYGIMNFLLSAAAIAYVLAALAVLKKKEAFDISLWVAGIWSVESAFWRLIDLGHIGKFASFGILLALMASLGAAGTFGVVIYRRFIKKKS